MWCPRDPSFLRTDTCTQNSNRHEKGVNQAESRAVCLLLFTEIHGTRESWLAEQLLITTIRETTQLQHITAAPHVQRITCRRLSNDVSLSSSTFFSLITRAASRSRAIRSNFSMAARESSSAFAAWASDKPPPDAEVLSAPSGALQPARLPAAVSAAWSDAAGCEPREAAASGGKGGCGGGTAAGCA